MILYKRKYVIILGALLALFAIFTSSVKSQISNDKVSKAKSVNNVTKPNIILLLADDLGWGDTGFNGNDVIQTPNLDKMAANGLVFNHFYAASSICSPTRGSLLTGRDPYRYGILAAHTAGMRTGEITIAEALNKNGYTTGFFGKWHLGWVKPNQGRSRGYYSPPWHHGFEVSFATMSAVPLWNPTVTPAGWNSWGQQPGEPWKGGKPYVHHDNQTKGWGHPVTKDMSGDDSRIIMDRVVPFIRKSVKKDKPFLAYICFHTPHEPVVAGPKYRALYNELDSLKQNYYGAITAMDQQVGRLRQELENLGIGKNTFILFTSDNGKAGEWKSKHVDSDIYRGYKHNMYDGGVHVPAFMSWPGHIKPGRTDALAGTSDFMPTVLDLGGLNSPSALRYRPMDGVSLKTVLFGDKRHSGKRPKPVISAWMRLYKNERGVAVIGNRYKLVNPENANAYELYDLRRDSLETNDIAGEHPAIFRRMKQELEKWQRSTTQSREGADYVY